MTTEERAIEEAARARDEYIDALTEVATVALRKAGLLGISESRNQERLRDAIRWAVM
jgi:hypothetical protein